MFANFLLDKASHPSTDSDDSDAEDQNGSGSAGIKAFPSFEEYLRERSEIKKILSRRTLD